MTQSLLNNIIKNYPIDAAAKEIGRAILHLLNEKIPEENQLRYSVFLDLIAENLVDEFDEKTKDYEYGAFVDLVIRKLAGKDQYDRDFLFLLWGLMTRKRWLDADQITDWLLEVVETYFETKGWDIEVVYQEAYSTLSKQ